MRPRMYGSRLRKWWRTSTWPSCSVGHRRFDQLEVGGGGFAVGARRQVPLLVDRGHADLLDRGRSAAFSRTLRATGCAGRRPAARARYLKVPVACAQPLARGVEDRAPRRRPASRCGASAGRCSVHAALRRAHEGGLHLDRDHAARIGPSAALRGCASHAPSRRRAASSRRRRAPRARSCAARRAGRSAISLSPSSKRSSCEAEQVDERDVAREGQRGRGHVVQPPCTALTPPSTARICPVMCLPASRGEQQRRALQVVVVAQALQRRRARPCLSAPMRGQHALGHLGSGRSPAQIALTVMPYLPHSPASVRVKLTTAPLLVL